MPYKERIAVEIKSNTVDGPTVDQIAGTVTREEGRHGWISHIFVYCLGFTRNAKKREKELSSGKRKVTLNAVKGRQSETNE